MENLQRHLSNALRELRRTAGDWLRRRWYSVQCSTDFPQCDSVPFLIGQEDKQGQELVGHMEALFFDSLPSTG